MDPVIVLAKFEIRSFTRSWENSDWSFGWDANPQSWGRGGRRESGWYRSKERRWFPIGPHSNVFSIFTRFRDIRPTAFVLQNAIFPIPPLVSHKFPHVPLGAGGCPVGYEEQKVQLVSKLSNLCDHNPPTSQTDGRTTCDHNTALCAVDYSASRGKNGVNVLSSVTFLYHISISLLCRPTNGWL